MHIQLLDFKYFLDKTEKLLTSYGYSPDYCYFSHYDSLTLSFSKEEKNDNLYFTYPQKGGAKTVYFDDILKLSFRDDEMEKSIHLFIEVFLFIYKKLKDRIERKLLLTSEQGKVTSKKAEARTSPEFIEANGKIALFEAIVDLIQAAINKANRRYTNLSRQISLRGQDFDRTQRNNNASYGNPTNISGSRGKVRRMP